MSGKPKLLTTTQTVSFFIAFVVATRKKPPDHLFHNLLVRLLSILLSNADQTLVDILLYYLACHGSIEVFLYIVVAALSIYAW